MLVSMFKKRMKQNKLFTQTNYCAGTTSPVDSVVTTSNCCGTITATYNYTNGYVSASSGNLAVWTGTGTVYHEKDHLGYFDSSFIKNLCDEKKIVIDISKRSALLKDFAGTSSYEIKKMDTKTKGGEDYFVVSVERVLLPGELSLYKKNKNKEILIEFSDSLPDERDGRKWILNGVLFWGSQTLTNVFVGTIANDLVAVQPMGGPIGNLFYMDYKYGNNEDVVPYNGDRTQTI